MEESKKRSLRRHHFKRIKVKRSSYYGMNSWDATPDILIRHRGLIARTAKLCSCWMCGNPRKHRKEKSLAEISHKEFLKLFTE